MSKGNVSRAVINHSDAGDNSIVTPASGSSIEVGSLVLIADSAVTLTIKSGSSAISGPMALEANRLYSFGPGLFQTATNGAFVLHLGSGVQVSGAISYRESQ